MVSHKTELVESPCGDTVELDCKISKLVQLLWKCGVRTIFSCELEPPVHNDAVHILPKYITKGSRYCQLAIDMDSVDTLHTVLSTYVAENCNYDYAHSIACGFNPYTCKTDRSGPLRGIVTTLSYFDGWRVFVTFDTRMLPDMECACSAYLNR